MAPSRSGINRKNSQKKSKENHWTTHQETATLLVLLLSHENVPQNQIPRKPFLRYTNFDLRRPTIAPNVLKTKTLRYLNAPQLRHWPTAAIAAFIVNIIAIVVVVTKRLT